jgi:hypothetical protein
LKKNQNITILKNKRFTKMKKILLLLAIMIMIIPASIYADVSVDLINQDPDPAIAGDIVELRIGLENTNNQAVTGLTLELDEQYPIKLANGEDATTYVAKIGAFQDDEDKQIIKYDVIIDKDASAGTYTIPIKYYFNSPEEYIIEEIEIIVSTSNQIEIVSIDTTSLKPGEQKDVNFRIKNVGTSSLTDLKFTWASEGDAVLPVGGDNTYFVSTLAPGQVTDLPFQVFADTTTASGLYKLTTTIEYEDESGKQEVNSDAGIYIGGETDFVVSFSSLSNNELSLDIANIGSNPAYSVLVKIPTQDGYKVSGANTEMIGNLENGDYTVVSYSMTTTNSKDALKVSVEYTDTRGIRQTITNDVELNINNGLSGSGDMTREEIIAEKKANGQSSGKRNPMSGMSSAISSVKTFGTYAVIGIAILSIVIVVYRKTKKNNSGKKRK